MFFCARGIIAFYTGRAFFFPARAFCFPIRGFSRIQGYFAFTPGRVFSVQEQQHCASYRHNGPDDFTDAYRFVKEEMGGPDDQYGY